MQTLTFHGGPFSGLGTSIKKSIKRSARRTFLRKDKCSLCGRIRHKDLIVEDYLYRPICVERKEEWADTPECRKIELENAKALRDKIKGS